MDSNALGSTEIVFNVEEVAAVSVSTRGICEWLMLTQPRWG